MFFYGFCRCEIMNMINWGSVIPPPFVKHECGLNLGHGQSTIVSHRKYLSDTTQSFFHVATLNSWMS